MAARVAFVPYRRRRRVSTRQATRILSCKGIDPLISLQQLQLKQRWPAAALLKARDLRNWKDLGGHNRERIR